MKELNEFFEINWIENTPKIFLIKDRKTINKLKEKKTENWLVGWVEDNNIYLLDKENYESESCHKYSNEEYLALFKHELVHLFTEIICKEGDFKPIWLNEGLSIYLSGQNKFKKKPRSFKKFLSFYNKGGKGVYQESGFVIEILIENFGKEKLLSLLKNLKNIKTKKEFEQKFEKTYSFKPSYENFNKFLN